MNKIGLAAIVLLLSGCTSTQRIAELGVISPEITAVEAHQLQKTTVTKGVSGSDSTGVFLFFPQGYPNLEYAVRRALDSAEADILVNAKAEYKSSWYLLGGENTITVKGDAVKLAPMFGGFE